MGVFRSVVATIFIGLLVFATHLHAQEAPKFANAVETALDHVIIPNHQAFYGASTVNLTSLVRLCARPSSDHLTAARTSFKDLLTAWSRVEMFRFGPAREDNRFEQLFYWPDRKGRGLKQVQRALASEDPQFTDSGVLAGKSIAVKGLPALEFVLFGTGSDTLAAGNPFRCAFAEAIARVIESNANALLAGWNDADGYGDLMKSAGSDGSPYKTHGEAVQDLLRAASEQLEIVRNVKLAAALNDTPQSAKPKRAPFWRSDMTLPTVSANISSVNHLFEESINDLLAPEHVRQATALSFEIAQVTRTMDGLEDNWLDLSTSTDGHQKLSYVLFPLNGAVFLIREMYPAALGLTLGFNSLDGD
ncbi:MAG: imelysin family protein [Roseibium sp.]|nr:imelysin family protein [Roseibium sp.]